jgi:hypothetical protein
MLRENNGAISATGWTIFVAAADSIYYHCARSHECKGVYTGRTGKLIEVRRCHVNPQGQCDYRSLADFSLNSGL